MYLSTPRLTLTPLALGDVPEMHALWTLPDVRRYLWDDVEISLEQARLVVEASTRDVAERKYGLCRVSALESGALVGFAGCRPWQTEEPELCYGLHPDWWGRGLATEASEAVLAHVFETCGHPMVVAATDPPNVASVRVLARLGMSFDVRAEVHGLETLVYRLSRERWRCRHASPILP